MTKIKKSVITAAGSGTRLLPFTKETPKEMLPYCVKSIHNKPILKPILHVIYESIFDFGIKEFCFVVGRSKRSIEDYFLADYIKNDTFSKNKDLKLFFQKVGKSNLTYVQQPYPKGFGDAVLKSKMFVSNSSFLLHAGDDLIISKENNHLKRLESAFVENDADVAFLVDRVKDPRPYGVIEGTKMKNSVINVENLEEKPRKPKSNIAVIATYLFKSSIFRALEKTKPDKNGEIQLADAVQYMIKKGKVIGIPLKIGERRVDVGTPESYVKSLNESFKSLRRI